MYVTLPVIFHQKSFLPGTPTTDCQVVEAVVSQTISVAAIQYTPTSSSSAFHEVYLKRLGGW
jgi:hypothetical protein